jgi:hypothetical protein
MWDDGIVFVQKGLIRIYVFKKDCSLLKRARFRLVQTNCRPIITMIRDSDSKPSEMPTKGKEKSLPNKRQQLLRRSPHSNNIPLLANPLIQHTHPPRPRIHAIRVPPRLLLPPQPLRQTLNLRTLPLSILDINAQPIHPANDRARDAETSEEDDLHVRDEDLLGAPVALVG